MSGNIILGKGMHQSRGNSNLIITLEADARIGLSVTDKDGKYLGKIFDIFGPVETPYASIKLNEGIELGKIEGKLIFLGKPPAKKKRKTKKKKHVSR